MPTKSAPADSNSDNMFPEEYSKEILPLHAGVLCIRNEAHLFLAPTGTGKTTLMAYLTACGFGYINDDCALYDMEKRLLLPKTKPLHLRRESIPILKSSGCDFTGEHMLIDGQSRFVFMPETENLQPMPIARLYFIERGGANSYCPLKGTEAVQLIMQNLITPKVDFFACLRAAASLAPKCRRLTYADECMDFVKEMLENG